MSKQKIHVKIEEIAKLIQKWYSAYSISPSEDLWRDLKLLEAIRRDYETLEKDNDAKIKTYTIEDGKAEYHQFCKNCDKVTGWTVYGLSHSKCMECDKDE